MKKAIETFAWEGGLVHWGTEVPDDDAAVKAFPQFFEPVADDKPRRARKPKDAADA